jgi:hypothetical protein
MFLLPPCTRMLLAQSLNPTAFPQFSRLAANLASMEGFLLGGFEASADSIIRITHMDAKPAEFLFHLQHFKLDSSLLLEHGDQRFQVLTEPPQYVEPTITMLEAPPHSCVANVALSIEPPGPTL